MARKWFATCALLFAACGSGDEGAASTAGPFPGSPGNPWTPNIPKPVQGPVLLAPGEPEAMAFDEAVDHGWFPLEPGVLRTYEGTDEGRFRVDLVRTLEPKRVLEGVACRAVMQEVFLDGVLYEVTTEWFAQDAQGNVWKFGEESSEREGVVWALSGDSWLAGVDGARPWLFLAAAPEKGDVYVGNAADGQDVLVVVATGVGADVPAGRFDDCLEIHENPDDPEDSDIILVGPGAGLVSEESVGGRIDLVSVVDERTSR